jgi:nucleoside-diphosphate-sugar epimerase
MTPMALVTGANGFAGRHMVLGSFQTGWLIS